MGKEVEQIGICLTVLQVVPTVLYEDAVKAGRRGRWPLQMVFVKALAAASAFSAVENR